MNLWGEICYNSGGAPIGFLQFQKQFIKDVNMGCILEKGTGRNYQ